MLRVQVLVAYEAQKIHTIILKPMLVIKFYICMCMYMYVIHTIILKPMLVIKFYICMCMYMLLARSELLNRVFFLFCFCFFILRNCIYYNMFLKHYKG